MFYLLKRIDEKQFAIGDVVMVLADFSGVPAGTQGVVTEIYDGGLMVTWARLESSKMNRLNTIETIHDRLRHKIDGGVSPFPASVGWLSDGFGRDELEYLAVRTERHPKLSTN